MKRTTKTALAATAAVLAAFGSQPAAHAQTADSLIDKLVEKGILTTKEGQSLREESDKDFTRAYSAKTGMPDWVTSLKFNGDFRGRFEKHNSENPAHSDRNRFRYRLRFGATASLLEDFEVGFRLASGDSASPFGSGFGGNPVTANTTMGDGFSRKFLWVDTAYAKWTPIHTGDWLVSGMFGKMDNVFTLGNMVFDPDIQPEGAALQMAYTVNEKNTLKMNSAFYVLDENNQGAAASRDPFLVGVQLALETKWNDKLDTALGLSAFSIANKDNLLNASMPNQNDGNTRTIAGAPLHGFNPIIGDASITYKFDKVPYYDAPFPVKLAGQYLQNPSAPTANRGWNAGVTFGKAGHKGLWEVAYRYQRMEADAWFEELLDDDNGAYYQAGPVNSGNGAGYRGGTNVKGHLMKVTYNFTDFFNLSATYYLNTLINPSPAGSINESGHFMLDFMWKF